MIKIIKKKLFLFGILAVYILLFIINLEKAISAIGNTGYYLKEMLIIMPVVFLLTALIDAWVPKNMIMKALGDESGLKGSFTALALGSISAGPIYAAFPVAKTLLKKGASVGNIVVILSAWAVVKLPMLANEVKFLGVRFMITRWLLTVIAIITMGYIVSKLVKKEDISFREETINEGEIKIDENTCIGCGICTKIAPDYFSMGEIDRKKVAISKVDYSKAKDKEKVAEARDKCPVRAIKIGDNK